MEEKKLKLSQKVLKNIVIFNLSMSCFGGNTVNIKDDS